MASGGGQPFKLTDLVMNPINKFTQKGLVSSKIIPKGIFSNFGMSSTGSELTNILYR